MTSARRVRIDPLPAGEWSDRERQLLRGNLGLADRYLSGGAGSLPIPPILGLLARRPDIGGPWLAFSGALIERGLLSPRDRELLILRVGTRTGCRYLWSQHLRMGVAAGLSQSEISAVREETPESSIWSQRDLDLLGATDQMLDDRVVADATWRRLTGYFGEAELIELLFLIGSYICLAMVLNSVGLEAQEQED